MHTHTQEKGRKHNDQQHHLQVRELMRVMLMDLWYAARQLLIALSVKSAGFIIPLINNTITDVGMHSYLHYCALAIHGTLRGDANYVIRFGRRPLILQSLKMIQNA